MKRKRTDSLKRRARKAWPLVAVILVTLLAAAFTPLLVKKSSEVGVQRMPRITRLIYPTFGNPAIVPSGDRLTLEVDPHDGRFEGRFAKLSNFEVEMRSSNDAEPHIEKPKVHTVTVGYSARWPEYVKTAGVDTRVYLVTVTVPREAPEDLYDLKISAFDTDRQEWIADQQPHSLKAIAEFKDRFSFFQLTDVHVYGPECVYGSASYFQRSARPNGIDAGRKGAIYYQDTIDQINVMQPDFCIITGDFVYGQAYWTEDMGPPWGWTSEYAYEMMWFYEETLKLDVPVYMLPGNHDSFAEGREAAGEDWLENWRRLYGPVYYSFDYGDSHFLMVNAQDWPVKQRTLEDRGVSIQSEKNKGQFRGGGDAFQPGVSTKRLDDIDESGFTGQLAWIRDDLKEHENSAIRIAASHQDPWLADGKGQMWTSEEHGKGTAMYKVKEWLGFAGSYGNGYGRLAFVKMMRDYDVAMVASGHFHSDSVGSLPWKDGNGKTWYVNTTCAMYPTEGSSKAYPGYRRIWIDGGNVESFNYAEPKWSYPWYAGTKVGQTNSMLGLKKPAVTSQVTPGASGSSNVQWVVSNALDLPLEGVYTKLSLPYLSDGLFYTASGGAFGAQYDGGANDPNRRICQLLADAPAGGSVQVTVKPSAAPDTTAPYGMAKINGGQLATSSREVTLEVDAVDEGGAGVIEMMISNDPDFAFSDWEPYRRNVTWQLPDGYAGLCTVFVKVRDGAMPPNTSEVFQANINLLRLEMPGLRP